MKFLHIDAWWDKTIIRKLDKTENQNVTTGLDFDDKKL